MAANPITSLERMQYLHRHSRIGTIPKSRGNIQGGWFVQEYGNWYRVIRTEGACLIVKRADLDTGRVTKTAEELKGESFTVAVE